MTHRAIPRRDFMKKAGAAAAVAGTLWPRSWRASAVVAAPRRPNVLMLVADDQRSDTIAALGNDHIKTPALDSLVRDGFAFTRARCQGAQQGAVCVPARAMIMTGRTLFRAPENLPAPTPILAELLAKAGYTTFGCGKWHNGAPSFARGFTAGGNIFFGGMHDQYQTPVHAFDPSGKYGPKHATVPGKFSSELFADAADGFLRDLKRDKATPFFCYLAFTSPHDPRTPPPPYDSMYDPAKMPLPPNFLAAHPFDNGELRIRDELLAPFPRTEADTRKQICDYYGMITSQDAQVARLLRTLDQTGEAEDTIVVYTGDHGLAIGSHGLFGKQNVYEHSVGVPLLLRGPGVRRGGRSDALVHGFDILPTLCEFLGVNLPAGVEGKSLLDVMSGKAASPRDATFHAYLKLDKGGAVVAGQRAVTDGRWKLIRYDVGGSVTRQLFDLAQDPAETRNLASDPSAAAELDRLASMLVRLQRELGDPASA